MILDLIYRGLLAIVAETARLIEGFIKGISSIIGTNSIKGFSSYSNS